MNYIFGREIAKVTLEIYQPGDRLDFGWANNEALIDPETMTALKDDESSDSFVELVKCDDLDMRPDLKALKPVWVIRLNYFSDGGLDYIAREGWWESDMEGWELELAAKFKAQQEATEQVRKNDLIVPSGGFKNAWDWLYVVYNIWWSGSYDYWEDTTELHVELEGVLDENKVLT